MCVRAMLHIVIFLSSAFKLWQRLDQNQSVELLQEGREDNSFKIPVLHPHLTLQPNILFFSKENKTFPLLYTQDPCFFVFFIQKKTGTQIDIFI